MEGGGPHSREKEKDGITRGVMNYKSAVSFIKITRLEKETRAPQSCTSTVTVRRREKKANLRVGYFVDTRDSRRGCGGM
jgi:hypothetical protein